MMRPKSVLVGLAMAALAGNGLQATTPSAPDFKEVYDLVSQHLTGATPAGLNAAAVRGFVSALNPRVVLETNETASGSTGPTPVVLKTNLFEGNIGYLRVGRVGSGLAEAVRAAFEHLDPTNKLDGLVIDLRYAGGQDYAAAAGAADVFVSKKEPLLNWGAGSAESTQKTNAIRLPVAALVNGETSYASEALAALLRDTGSGLIIGSRTAGRAMITKDFKLSNGDELRIATAPIQVGSAGALSSEGLKPDIEVSVSPEYERQYYADAFKVINAPAVASAEGAVTNQGEINATNQARRPIFNEAELVRERKQGIEGEQASAPPPPSEPQQPVVHDPALARALDLLKGLAVVRHSGE